MFSLKRTAVWASIFLFKWMCTNVALGNSEVQGDLSGVPGLRQCLWPFCLFIYQNKGSLLISNKKTTSNKSKTISKF